MTSGQMPRAYNAADVEQRIYQEWESKGYFHANIEKGREPYVIIMPPPNVTGELHLGHALEKALEDALTRWRRMSGVSTLWLPGTDHAGIATQWAVERRLAEEGQDRHELGRERFLELVWEHVGKFGGIIHEQSRRLGISADWDRHKFTLDPGPSNAVRTTFVNLYHKGLIYRHERIINWCTRCATALSDLEVDYQDVDGKLYHIQYPLEDDPNSYVTVATTRPETMLGDTGVAVHPDDARYEGIRGRNVVLPIMDRLILVVGDEAIDPEFGTGALKVTPAHDPVDFEIGQRHSLEIINVIGPDGNMTESAGKYVGVERGKARELVVAELERLGRLEKIEEYRHSVGHCQRCSSVVEPLISLQWFVNVGSHDQPDSIAGKAHAAVANGDIKLVPERFTRVYLNWLENIRDWCISRQLWWGHRIPVWHCGACGHMTVLLQDPEVCEDCGSSQLEQDPDVLDTWFSSGLWPHSTLGWPEDTEDFRYFYPTTVLETGYDILFFWVARMIMLGIENTGQVPFRTVFLHGLIRDATGAKMSKTRGNTLDPLEMVDKYGTDALRFALTTGTAPGNDLRFTENRLEAGRNFANKIWNAARFVISGLEGKTGLEGWRDLPAPQHREDRWIVSRLDRVTAEVTKSLENFELGDAQQKLYDFIWNDYCDWYIEMAKIRMRAGSEPSPLPTLAHVLERTLRLLHPFMPFITEEVWRTLISILPSEGEVSDSIMIAPFPAAGGRLDVQAEEEIGLVMQAVRAVRNTRAQLRIPAGQHLEALVEANGQQAAIEDEADVIRTLSRVEPLRIVAGGAESQKGPKGVTLVVNPLVVHLPLEGVVDLAAEAERLKSERDDCMKNLDRVEKLVSNPNFRSKAKPEVVETEEARLTDLRERKQRLDEILAQLGP
jgi:valyl-tRNA synthetase